MQRHSSKTSITSIGSTSRVGEKKPLPTHTIIQRESDNEMILLPVTHLVNSSVARIKLNNTATFKTDLSNRKQERGRILQLGNKEECIEQLQVFEMTADIDAYEKTNNDDDEEEGEKDKNKEEKKEKQSKHQKSFKQLSTTSSYEGACTSSGLNGNIHIYSSKKSTNVVKQKQNIKSKYLQIDEESKESSSEEDANNVTFKESFDDDISSKKNVQSHTTVSVGKQTTYAYSKKSSNKDQDQNRFISKSQITIGSQSRNNDNYDDDDDATHHTSGFVDQDKSHKFDLNDNNIMCRYEALSKEHDQLLKDHRALRHEHKILVKENQLLKRTTMPMPDAAGRQWFINTGKYFANQGPDTNIQVHAKALNIKDVRDLINCIDDTTTSTARQVVKLLYSPYELITQSGKVIPDTQREAIRAFAESQKGPVANHDFNEAINGVFRSAKSEFNKDQQRQDKLASNNNHIKPSQSMNKGQKTLTQMMKKNKVVQLNSNRTIVDKENNCGEGIDEAQE